MEQGFTLIDPTKPQRTRKPFKPKVYWTPKDVMAHYQVSAATVSRWKKRGAPFVGPGKHSELSLRRWSVGLHDNRRPNKCWKQSCSVLFDPTSAFWKYLLVALAGIMIGATVAGGWKQWTR